MALTFCSRCGHSQEEGDLSHFRGACELGKAVHSAQLSDGTHVRCPVEGCPFKTKLTGKSGTVRARFDYHLNWHVENKMFGAVTGEKPSAFQALHAAAINAGCTVEDVEACKRVLGRVLGLE